MAARFTLAALSVSLGAALPAAPQSAPQDIIGAWAFETNRYHGGACRLRGTLHLRDNKTADSYACALTAVEECDFDEPSVVEQSCQAERTGDALTILSTVDAIRQPVDGSLTYYPDNFALTVESPDQMIGFLLSAVEATAEFRRTSEAIS
ncbi:MAG: hypothetical protein AAFQ67_01205 [Pseudomonadota bacterium]